LPARVHAARDARAAVSALGAPPALRRKPVPADGGGRGGGRGRAVSGEADELPDAHSHLRLAAAQLPRPPDPARGNRQRVSQRALRDAARHAARARAHDGRRAHLPARGPDRAGDLSAARHRRAGARQDVRAVLPARPRHAAGPEARLGRDVGAGGARARAGAQAPRPDLSHRSGRRSVLRPQNRREVQRRDRPRVAGGDDPARLRAAGAVSARVRGRGQQAAPPRDDPPRRLRYPGAVLRLPDRAFRGRVPAVACSRASARAADRGYAASRGTHRAATARGRRPARRGGRAQRDPELQDPRRRDAQGSVHGSGGAARGRRGNGRRARARRGKEAGGAAGGRIRGETPGGGSHEGIDPVSLNVELMPNEQTTPVILSACRTPIGKYLGGLSPLPAPRLGALVIREAVRRAAIDPAAVEEVIMGNVLQGGVGQAPARQAAIHAGLPGSIPALSVNKVCGSGLKAVMLAAQAIKAGDAQCVVAGGMESMSNAPHYVFGMRAGIKAGNSQLVDGMIHDGLWDSFSNTHMGNLAEYSAKKAGVSRQDQDAFALASHQKAVAAMTACHFKAETVGVEIPGKRGPSVIEKDEGPRADTTLAVQALADGRALGWDWERVNVHGGAIALGHPIGASGARVLTTLLYALKDRHRTTGLATLCLGGGNAVALSVEMF